MQIHEAYGLVVPHTRNDKPLLVRKVRRAICKELRIPFKPVIGYEGSRDPRWRTNAVRRFNHER